MSRAISVRLERTTSAGRAGGQRKHDLRLGNQPNYVDGDRSHLNRVLIEPPPPAELRSRAAARRAAAQPKRAMRSNASIAERGIIAFGNDIQAAIRTDPDRADALYGRVAEAIGKEFGIEVTGLVAHEDEAAPHAHFWLDSFDRSGKAVSRRLGRSGSKIQDIAAEAARPAVPEIERGRSQKSRVEAGEDPADLRHRSVAELHGGLGLPPGAGAGEVAEAVQTKRKAEAEVAEIERRWQPDLGLLATGGQKRLAQRDRAFAASLREIERKTASPEEKENRWTIHDGPRREEISRALHPGPLGWGTAIWEALRRFADAIRGREAAETRTRQIETRTARRDAALAAALDAIDGNKVEPIEAEGR